MTALGEFVFEPVMRSMRASVTRWGMMSAWLFERGHCDAVTHEEQRDTIHCLSRCTVCWYMSPSCVGLLLLKPQSLSSSHLSSLTCTSSEMNVFPQVTGQTVLMKGYAVTAGEWCGLNVRVNWLTFFVRHWASLCRIGCAAAAVMCRPNQDTFQQSPLHMTQPENSENNMCRKNTDTWETAYYPTWFSRFLTIIQTPFLTYLSAWQELR